jgi:hypothetical protein
MRTGKKKTEVPGGNLPQLHVLISNPMRLKVGLNPIRCGVNSATNRPRCGTACIQDKQAEDFLSMLACPADYALCNYCEILVSQWRMASSGMLRRVALVRTDVSEELSASFIRATRIGELGTMLAVTRNWRTLRRNTNVTLMKEARSSSETSVLTRATRRNIQEDAILHSHRRESLKSYRGDVFHYFSFVTIVTVTDLLKHNYKYFR